MSSTSKVVASPTIRFLAAALACAASLWTHALAAQSGGAAAESDPARDASARALFEEGVTFAEAGDSENAEDRFRRALSLRESPVIVYNLASTLVDRGKLVEASELLHRLTRDPKLDPELAQSANTLQAEISPRIARLRVSVDHPQPSDVVTLDGAALLPAQLGVEIPVDPGHHELTLARDDSTVDTQTVDIPPSSVREITLRSPAGDLSPQHVAAASVTPAQPLPAQPRDASTDRPITEQWWFWAGAAVLAGAAIATVAVLAADSEPQTRAPFQGNFDPPALGLEVAP